MSSRRFARRLPAVAGASAIVVMVALTAGCGGGANNQPSTTTPATTTTAATTTPSPSPTEKNINPTGGNLFTPEPHPVQPAPSQNPHRRGAS